MAKLYCPDCGHQFQHEGKHFGKGIAGAGGAVGGGFIGASIGIALLGTAISGMLPVAALGAYAVGKLGKKFVDDPKCPKCDKRFTA